MRPRSCSRTKASRQAGASGPKFAPVIGGAHRLLRQHAADLIGLLLPGAGDRLPDLLLARMVGRDGEGHELLERHAVLGIDVEQGRRDRRQAEALLHDVHADEERRGDVLLGAPLLAQSEEGAELIERMQRRALDVLGQRIVLAEDVGAGIADHARNWRGLRQALLLHQQFERPVAPAAGRDLEHAGLGALGVEDRPDVEALEQRASGDVLGQFLDRDAGLHAPDVGLAQHQLIEGNVARGRQGDLLNGSSHGGSLRGGRPRDSLSTSNPPRKPAQPSSSRRTAPQSRRTRKMRSRKSAFPLFRISGGSNAEDDIASVGPATRAHHAPDRFARTTA